VGRENAASPTLSSLAGPFGLWPLLDKRLAVFTDARLSGRTDTAQVVENLLRVSGEDPVDVHRKNLPTITVRLPARFMVITNELPRLTDASGALASRLLILRLTRSFLGWEDHGLAERLLGELPAIFLWAVEGLRHLLARGYFEQPRSGAELIRAVEDLGSPVQAFVRESCTLEPGAEINVEELFGMWKGWCEREGRDHPGPVNHFSRDLRAAYPAIGTGQRRRDRGERFRVFTGIRRRCASDEDDEAGEEADLHDGEAG
jgi:putative DNA primase/helicase